MGIGRIPITKRLECGNRELIGMKLGIRKDSNNKQIGMQRSGINWNLSGNF